MNLNINDLISIIHLRCSNLINMIYLIQKITFKIFDGIIQIYLKFNVNFGV